jgi:hypothetical protein
MAGPVLFVVDHDESSLRVLLADLTRQFGGDFTVKATARPKARSKRCRPFLQEGCRARRRLVPS